MTGLKVVEIGEFRLGRTERVLIRSWTTGSGTGLVSIALGLALSRRPAGDHPETEIVATDLGESRPIVSLRHGAMI